MVVVWTVPRSRPYLKEPRRIIHGDQDSLNAMLSHVDVTGRLMWWRFRLSQLDSDFVHSRGIKEEAGDALLRLQSGVLDITD